MKDKFNLNYLQNNVFIGFYRREQAMFQI